MASQLTREELEQLVAELQQRVEDQQYDWNLMNEFLCVQATMMGWCDEFEERIQKYNKDFRVLKAYGRVPEGQRVSVRNAFAARRLVMGHVINTLSRYGIHLPGEALCGVVRDHQALARAHDQLTAHLSGE